MQPEQTPVSRGHQLCLGEFSGLDLSSADLSVAQDCGIHAYSVLLKSYTLVLGYPVVPQCLNVLLIHKNS